MEVSRWVHRLDPFVLLDSLCAMIKLNLFEDELLVLGNFQTKQFKVEIEVTYWLTCGLIVLEMQPLHVGMRQCLINCDPTGRVKGEHFLDKVDSVFVCTSE